MLEDPVGMRGDRLESRREGRTPGGRRVRNVLDSWTRFGSLVAILGIGACLLGDCDGTRPSPARRILIGTGSSVRSIAFRPDGASLSSVGQDGSMAIFDLKENPRNPRLFPWTGRVRSAAFSPDNKVIATANAAATVVLRDLVQDESRTLDDRAGSTTGAACLAFSPDGATLAVGQQGGEITLWDVTTGRHRSSLLGHAEFVASLVYAPDGAMLASTGRDRTTRIWELATSRQRFAISGPVAPFVALAFSPDGRLLCLGDQATAVVRLWDVKAGVERAALSGAAGPIVALGISPDGTTLAAADYMGEVTCWDLATFAIRPKRLKHAGVRSLAFAPDGQTLATGGFDGSIHLWAFPIASGN